MKAVKKIKFRNIVITESAVLAAALVIFRVFVFRLINDERMLHITLSTHAFMIGATLTIFCAFALTVKRAWKAYGKLMLLPAIFTLFGILMQIMAYDVDF